MSMPTTVTTNETVQYLDNTAQNVSYIAGNSMLYVIRNWYQIFNDMWATVTVALGNFFDLAQYFTFVYWYVV